MVETHQKEHNSTSIHNQKLLVQIFLPHIVLKKIKYKHLLNVQDEIESSHTLLSQRQKIIFGFVYTLFSKFKQI